MSKQKIANRGIPLLILILAFILRRLFSKIWILGCARKLGSWNLVVKRSPNAVGATTQTQDASN